MTCPQCNSEMSKRWQPSGAKMTAGEAVIWACGVCGCQLTQADMKLSAKHAAEALPSAPTTTPSRLREQSDEEWYVKWSAKCTQE